MIRFNPFVFDEYKVIANSDQLMTDLDDRNWMAYWIKDGEKFPEKVNPNSWRTNVLCAEREKKLMKFSFVDLLGAWYGKENAA